MKVLMFGWEFPPQISGGLGTACAGLTQALEEENVDVLFVVPKLHGGEPGRRTSFINASTVPVIQRQLTVKSDRTISVTPPSAVSRHTTIEVPSGLTPYVSPQESASTGLLQWNYSFYSPPSSTLQAVESASETEIQQVSVPYSFSGGYGPKLFEEVERYAAVAAEVAQHHDFDVIHAHDWMTYAAGLAARRVSNKPLVIHIHATEIDRSGIHVNAGVFEIERKAMQLADHIVAVSQWTKNIAIAHYGVDENKISVIHNGISPRKDTVPQHAALPLGAPIVTFLGRITHQKGPMYFVEAARKVLEKFDDVHFVVAGAGDQLPNMIERIAQLKLSPQFHFTGFLRGADIDRVWRMSSVYVMPSVSEPFGIAPLEAIEAGVPVIMSRQAGVAEVMPHAIKVDFWNSDALAEAICNVLRFPSLANTLRKNGAAEIRNITWNKAARKLTTLYHELRPQQHPSTRFRQQKESGLLFPGASTPQT